ncbi:MAG: FAD-dependent oxidoreductase [Candidatus Omnitrophica bacterium]|nr:FAD-dependent oxidoreductase [Candidatus Omnitrophota bacterium]
MTPEYFDVTLRRIIDLGNETRHFELTFDPGTRIHFTAGQFVAVLCPKDGKLIRRAYSIASPPEEKDHVELIIKLVEGGVVTNWFWSLKEGDRFRVHGPFGKFVLPEQIDFDIVFVATGTGIAPFRSMIRHLLPAGFNKWVWLLFGSRYDKMIPYHKEWVALSRDYPNFIYIPTISRPSAQWPGEVGYVQTKIEKFFPDPAGKRVYICGLNDMIQAVQEVCLKQGFRTEQISFEKYD